MSDMPAAPSPSSSTTCDDGSGEPGPDGGTEAGARGSRRGRGRASRRGATARRTCRRTTRSRRRRRSPLRRPRAGGAARRRCGRGGSGRPRRVSSAWSRSAAALTVSCSGAHPGRPVGLAQLLLEGRGDAVEDQRQVAVRRAGEVGVTGDAGRGVGEVHDPRRGCALLAAERRRSRAGSPAGVPTTIVRSHCPSARPRALVISSGWPPGMTPRPMPLVIAGKPECSRPDAARPPRRRRPTRRSR